MEEEGGEETQVQGQYGVEFPELTKENTSKHSKWGPVQGMRVSSRLTGEKRTIIQKAQHLKGVQNLEIPKDPGKKQASFSLFNNPSFNYVASKIGIDVEFSGVDSSIPPSLHNIPLSSVCDEGSNRTVGSSSCFTTPVGIVSNHFIKGNSSDENAHASEEVWHLVCKHKRGKHPRTKPLL